LRSAPGLGLRALALLLAGLCVTVGAAAREPGVIVLSWDGLRHDYLARGALPALARLGRQGARAERLVPPFPSNTFPGHATLATGTHPDRHGILGNRFIDPERGLFDYENDASWLEAEPIWAAAERQGVRSAVFYWVGSETDWRGVGATYRKTPFESRTSEAKKVDQILAWLDLPQPHRPRLVMAWWHGADRAGHRRGPDHAAVAEALAEQDEQLGRLLAGLDSRGLWSTITLLLVGDHGMTAAGREIDAEAALAASKIAAHVVTGGGMAHVYLEDPTQRDAARRALARLPGVSVFAREALPERLRARHARAGDLVLLAEPPGMFRRHESGLRRPAEALLPGPRGMHGYDPAHADMGAAFLALGRAVPPGAVLGPIHAVDVAPTIAALLGIAPPQHSEGRPLFGAPAESAR
jgi:predicted AlkP superfamily pyrophosphatase or phosphodiesterase